MILLERPGFLIVPAYVIAITVASAAYYLLPWNIGIPVAAAIIVVLLSINSLLHPKIANEVLVHLLWLAFNLAIALAFAVNALAAIPEAPSLPAVVGGGNWWQVAFMAVQFACYVGIHAFVNVKK